MDGNGAGGGRRKKGSGEVWQKCAEKEVKWIDGVAKWGREGEEKEEFGMRNT